MCETVPCTTYVKECVIEKVPYTVCKKVPYTVVKQVPYTVTRMVRETRHQAGAVHGHAAP